MYKLGYVKDCIATLLFVVLLLFFIIVRDVNKYKLFFIIGLLLVILVDGAFSLYPNYHNVIIGYNKLTYFILFIGALLLLLLSIMLFLEISYYSKI